MRAANGSHVRCTAPGDDGDDDEAEAAPRGTEVLRRYSEFAELRRGLRAALPRLADALPALPTVYTFGKSRGAVVSSRRQALEEFLRAVVASPELLRRPEVNLFLGGACTPQLSRSSSAYQGV